MSDYYKHNSMGDGDYVAMFNALETGIISFGMNGHLVGANAMAWKIIPDLGKKLNKFSDFIHFVYDASLDFMEQSGLSFPQQHDINTAFYEAICINHNEFYLVRALQQGNGAMLVEMSDISQIKSRADDVRSLNRDNSILTEAIQSSSKGIFIAESNGERRILFANNALDQLLGRSSIPLVGYSLDAFLSSQFTEEWDNISAIIEGKQKGKFWRKIERGNTSQKWVSLSVLAEKSCGAGDLIIGFISDETQSKMQENHLLQTQKLEAIGKLAGGVAHDFNNILSIVEGYIRLSESALKRGEDISGNIDRIKKAVARGSGLTKQLLMFGKHRVSDNQIIDLCHQVQDMETLLQPLLGANIYLDIQTPDETLAIKATPDTISQIVMNLVLNARDAMLKGGEITVSVCGYQKDSRAMVGLRVTDTGCGMSPETIEKIFDPFFTTKEQGKGTGLGLSMVYGLVQQLGGTIDVTSLVGKGTDFIIEFPQCDASTIVSADAVEPSDKTGLMGKTILVAEDEQDLLVIMEATLTDMGMKVLKACNGNDALVIQDEFEGKIDFLLTDMVMPDVGGLKLAELMKEVRPETHIVFMSGYPVRGEIANVNLPSDAIFMAKPVKPDFLKNVLEQISLGQPVEMADAAMWQA